MRTALQAMGEAEEGRPRSSQPVARAAHTEGPDGVEPDRLRKLILREVADLQTNRPAGAMAAPVAEARSLFLAAHMRLRSFKAEAAVPRTWHACLPHLARRTGARLWAFKMS